MNRNNQKIRGIVVLTLALALVLSCVTVSFGAVRTKKMTVYNDIVKSGNYAYCSTEAGIYRVNMKNNKVVCLVKIPVNQPGSPMLMRVYKDYLYYSPGGGMTWTRLYRIKINGKGRQHLYNVTAYAISGNKIYTRTDVMDRRSSRGYKTHYKQMNLNGKNKKNSPYRIKMTVRRSSAKGYSVRKVSTHSGYTTEYLVKPNGKKIKLCRYS